MGRLHQTFRIRFPDGTDTERATYDSPAWAIVGCNNGHWSFIEWAKDHSEAMVKKVRYQSSGNYMDVKIVPAEGVH